MQQHRNPEFTLKKSDLAGIFPRLIALTFDAALLGGAGILLVWVGVFEKFSYDELLFVGPFVGAMYYSLLESAPWGATVGKAVVRIRVLTIQGRRAPFGSALLRWVIKFFSLIFGQVVLGFVGLIGKVSQFGFPTRTEFESGSELWNLVISAGFDLFGIAIIFWGFFLAVFSSSRQAFHDRFAGTVVVKAKTNRVY
jgi:uncharacterized RDD family membrane protein YckC